MGLMQTFLEILRLDPPPGRPTVDDYCAVEQERLDLSERCDALVAILKAKGETVATIERKVLTYRSAKLNAVKAGVA